MHLVRAVYYARNAIRKRDLAFSAEAKSIMAAIRRNNAAASLTGALVFNEHYFAQVIEGDRYQVSRTLWRIGEDRRQEDMVIVAVDSVTRRRFADWAMGYAGQSDELAGLYLRFGIVVGFDPARMTAESLTGLIAAMVEMDSARQLAGSLADASDARAPLGQGDKRPSPAGFAPGPAY
jgi:Sensors of blue-light using FAD.